MSIILLFMSIIVSAICLLLACSLGCLSSRYASTLFLLYPFFTCVMLFLLYLLVSFFFTLPLSSLLTCVVLLFFTSFFFTYLCRSSLLYLFLPCILQPYTLHFALNVFSFCSQDLSQKLIFSLSACLSPLASITLGLCGCVTVPAILASIIFHN